MGGGVLGKPITPARTTVTVTAVISIDISQPESTALFTLLVANSAAWSPSKQAINRRILNRERRMRQDVLL